MELSWRSGEMATTFTPEDAQVETGRHGIESFDHSAPPRAVWLQVLSSETPHWSLP